MATNMNVIAFHGNLTKDAVKETSQKGTTIIRFTVAVNRKRGEQERVSYIDVVAFDKTAEGAFEYLKKGKGVNVAGSVSQSRWEKDGKNYSRIEVIASQVQLADGGSKNSIITMFLNGNLTKDASVRTTQGGTPVIDLSVAVNRGENVSFIDCSYFNKNASNLVKYLTKGKSVNLEGILTQDRWEKDGQAHSRTYMLVSQVELLNAPQKKDEKAAPAPAAEDNGPENFGDDDIPF